MSANEDPQTTRPARAWWRRALSVRALMLVVLLAALAAGWSARAMAIRREAVATIRAAGGAILFEDQSRTATGLRVGLYRRTGWEFLREVAQVSLLKSPAASGATGGPSSPAPPLPSIDEAFAALGRLGHVERVQFKPFPIRPRHREALAAVGVASIRLISADGATFDESLAELGGVDSLRHLILSNGSVGATLPPAILRWVGGMSRLRGLTIQGVAGIEGPVPPPLEADATTLARLVDLEELQLTPSPVDGAFLDGLAGAHRLRIFGALGTRATDDQLRRLIEREPDLEDVGLDGSLLSDAGAEALGRLSRLEGLSIAGRLGPGPGITDATLGTVARLGALRRLFLYGGRFTDRGLEALRGATRLEALDLGSLDSASPEVLNRLLAGRSWKTLGLRGPAITDATLPAILPHVGSGTHLSLAHSGVTDAGMAALAAAPLRGVVLSGTAITDAGMVALAGSSIRTLIVNDTRLTDAGLLSLARSASLGRVDARGTRISPAGVAAFRRARGGRASVNLGPLRPEDE